ncbi:MAG: Rnf-Nqr domain containing protein [Acetanaerobacterium sp.]
MREILLQFFTYAAAAALIENLVLSRGIGTSTVLFSARSTKHILRFGALFTLMAVASSMAAYGINLLIAPLSFRVYIRPLVFILVLIILYYTVYFTLGRFMKSVGEYVRRHLPYATFNCALLGVLYIAYIGKYTLVQAAGFALGSGIGFTVASLLIAEGRRRLELAKLPRAFAGLPITLLYVGLISLALFGLVGHQLPF